MNSNFWNPALTFQRLFMSIASRRPAFHSPLLLYLLSHLLIFFLYITLTILTVTGCRRLSVIDQFLQLVFFSFVKREAKLAPPYIFSLCSFSSLTPLVYISFSWRLSFTFFVIRGFPFCAYLHLCCIFLFCF